jgi:hypothetical protein
MANSWDRPPIPTHGDSDDDTTYAGVGRVVTEWEQVELALSRLYSLFMGRFEHRETMREYGDGTVLKGRLERLARAHETFTRRVPDQALESEFDSLIERIRLFAERRNDVAHGLVWPIQWNGPPAIELGPFQFCVVPPDYKKKLFDPNNMPLYVYTRHELDGLQAVFFTLSDEVHHFIAKLYEIHEDRRGLV